MKKKELSYNEAYARLQEIQNKIENDELDVDELSNVLKETSVLLKHCKDKLLVVSEETNKILKEIQ